MRTLLRPALFLLLFTAFAAPAQQAPQPAPPNPIPPGAPRPTRQPPTAQPQGAVPQPGARPPTAPVPASPRNAPTPGMNVIGFTATPLGEVLEEYYRVTGRRVLRDRGLENVTVNIEVPGEFTEAEYLDIIEKGLLMHGYALVPSGENLFKLVAAEGDGSPSRQNVPLILREEELPQTDQVVTHVLQLRHLDAQDAATAFQQIIPPHSYGKIAAIPNARALIITEASQTIRAYLTLAKQVDLPPDQTRHKTIHLERADAEEVAGQLADLLGLDAAGSKSGGPSASRGTPQGTYAPPGTPAPTPPLPKAATGAPQTVSSAAIVGTGAEAAPPKIQAITRTNSLLVVARPMDIEYIESLIKELDAESPTRGFVSRRLDYIPLATFLNIASKALMRNSKDAAGATAGGATQTTTTTTPVSSAGGNAFGSGTGGFGGGYGGRYGGGGGFGGSLTGGGFSGGSQPLDLEITKKADSAIIGKTLVIVDPGSSKFIASGPPDELRMLNELADELDVRPRQIFLSAIVGEFTLGDEFNFGLDWINTIQRVGDDNLVGGILNTHGTAFADISTLGGVADFIGENGPAFLSGLTAYGQIGEHLNVFLRALEQTNRFQVLQKPTLTTLNHQPATIYIGQQIAIAGQTYTTGTGGVGNNLGFTSTTEYIPVRLQLDITPHIFNDKEVMLEFKQQNNDVSGFTTISGNRVPNISEQGMQNSLIVPDRTAVMLGGLITERDSNDKTGLPFLVRVPFLRHLVGSTNKSKSRRELMIFVQPFIMADGAAHVQSQSDWSKKTETFDPTLRFAQPQDNTPLEALPPSDGRALGASGVLPLPTWDAPRKVTPPAGASATAPAIPKAELVLDEPVPDKRQKPARMPRQK